MPLNHAEVAELADAADSKSAGVDSLVRVRLPPSAPASKQLTSNCSKHRGFPRCFLMGRTSVVSKKADGMIEEFIWKNLKFLIGEHEQVLEHIVQRIDSGEKLFVVTANASILYLFLSDEKYRECLEHSNLLTVDGIGAVYLLKKLSGVKAPRYPGIELMMGLCKVAAAKKWRVFLLGGKPGISEKVAEALKNEYPSIQIAGTMHGYFEEQNNEKVVQQIQSSAADLLFVAMGVPKQEYFIWNHFPQLNVKLAMGVGGAFDVISGNKRRAPRLIQQMGLEWLYRISLEPRKRAKTFLNVIRFAIKLWKGEIF